MIHFRGWRTSAGYCKQNAIKVKYEIAKNAVFRCPHCKARIQRRGTKWLTFIDTPINEYDVSLVVEAPRGYCPHCRQHMVLRPAEVHPTRRMTLRLISTIARWMKEASAALVAKQLRLSESTVLRADKDALTLADKKAPINMDKRNFIIIDEKYLGHVRKFVTIVIDGYTGELLWLKEGKSEGSLSEFFAGLGDEQRADIKFVSIDRSNSYLSAVRKWLPHAAVSFDPFHLIANLNSAIDEVRRQICRDMEKGERQVMKGKRFLLLRWIESMNKDSRKILEELLTLNKPLSEAYLLKEEFRKFLKAETFRLAAAGFRKWILMARKSSLKPFNNLAETLTRNRRQVLHTLRYGLSSGRIEGVNSMISRILHKARGIPSIGYIRLKLRQRTSPDFARLI